MSQKCHKSGIGNDTFGAKCHKSVIKVEFGNDTLGVKCHKSVTKVEFDNAIFGVQYGPKVSQNVPALFEHLILRVCKSSQTRKSRGQSSRVR